MPPALDLTLYTDPACPWAYSAGPAHLVLRWRYGDGLNWRLRVIGLAEDASRYAERGYTAEDMARGYLNFRRYGMPFTTEARARLLGTGRACRAIVAAGLVEPGAEWGALRALQLAWFTTTLLLDEDDGIATALAGVPGLDVAQVMRMLDGPEVAAAYDSDREAARTAEGSPTEFQGKAANTDGSVRYTAPSILFRRADGGALEAGGYQPVEAYDVVIANLDTTLARTDAATDAREILQRFPYGLTAQEIAAVMTPHLGTPDREAAEDMLLRLLADGAAERTPLAGGSLWSPPGAAVIAPPPEATELAA